MSDPTPTPFQSRLMNNAGAKRGYLDEYTSNDLLDLLADLLDELRRRQRAGGKS